jgi:hypothetical protein
MATNTEEYKIIIDTEVEGQKSVDELGASVELTGDAFVRLQKQIRDTQIELQKAAASGDTEAFKKLKGDLEELEDQLEAVQLRSAKFDDALADLPGPAGKVGQAIKGIDGAFKLLAANPGIAILGIASGLLLALRESLNRTERGQALLNKASEAFGKILGPIFATLEAVAFPVLQGFVKLLDLTAAGFNKVAKFLGVGAEQIEEASRNSSEVLKDQYDEQLKLQKEADDKAKKEQEKATKDRQDAAKKAREDADKNRKEADKKRVEDEQRALEEANKILIEAELSLLDTRSREIREREIRYNEERAKLQLAGVTDFTKFEEEYRIDILAINKKYDAEENKIKEENDAKVAAQDEKDKKDALARESQFRTDRISLLNSTFELEDSIRKQSYEAELDLFNQIRELEREELIAREVSAEALLAFDKQTEAARLQITRSSQEERLGIISNALGTVAGLFNENTIAFKAVSVAQAVIDTYAGATKALATYPPPFGAIAAGTVIAGGLINIRKILATKIPTVGKTGASGGGSQQISTPNIQAPSIGGTPIPQITGANEGLNPTQQITNTLSQTTNRPVKAYVVSGEISSQQSLDRRTSRASTFGG